MKNKILILNSLRYLQEWLNQHPKNNRSKEYLWYNPQGELLGYTGVNAMLKDAFHRDVSDSKGGGE